MVFYWRSSPFFMGEHEGRLPLWGMLVFMFTVGFALTLPRTNHRLLIPMALVCGLCATHLWSIVMDWGNDPTSHNLWPFELVAMVSLTMPAFLGGAFSAILRRSPK